MTTEWWNRGPCDLCGREGDVDPVFGRCANVLECGKQQGVLKHDWQTTADIGSAVLSRCTRCTLVRGQAKDGRPPLFVYWDEAEEKTRQTFREPPCEPDWYVAGRARRALAAKKQREAERKKTEWETIVEEAFARLAKLAAHEPAQGAGPVRDVPDDLPFVLDGQLRFAGW